MHYRIRLLDHSMHQCWFQAFHTSESAKQKTKNVKQIDTYGLINELKIKIGATAMLLTNIDISDKLSND